MQLHAGGGLGWLARHLRWLRTEGLARLVEADRLDPRRRFAVAGRKAVWRHTHPQPPGQARPVWLVGLQRSGTNMLVRGIDEAPEVEVHNESDRRVFHRFQLRSDAEVAAVIRRSRHRIVLLKPLCDSHRVVHLLDELAVSPGRAVWLYRDVDARTRSALRTFGESSLYALRATAADPDTPWRWQAGGLGSHRIAELRSFDLSRMSPATAAALLWYLRNSLFFDLGLHQRTDVLLVCYEALLEQPERETRRLAEFIGLPWSPALCGHIDVERSPEPPTLPVDPRVRHLCTGLAGRLERARLAAATPAWVGQVSGSPPAPSSAVR